MTQEQPPDSIPPDEDQPPLPEEEAVQEADSDAAYQSLQRQLSDCQQRYLRALADSENARKRMQKERQDTAKYAVENVLIEFLHPLDSFEKALSFVENMSDDVKSWAAGFDMLLQQFKHILANYGVEEYHSVGKPFDPHLHDAVEMVDSSDYPPGFIVEEYVRGYKIGDRPIRVARVKVAKASEPDQKHSNQETEG